MIFNVKVMSGLVLGRPLIIIESYLADFTRRRLWSFVHPFLYGHRAMRLCTERYGTTLWSAPGLKQVGMLSDPEASFKFGFICAAS